jgi:hypothetical protein
MEDSNAAEEHKDAGKVAGFARIPQLLRLQKIDPFA